MATLYEMGERLLEVVVGEFATAGIPLPSRQLVYLSPIPADCEQVAVLFSGWNPQPELEGPTVCDNFRWSADFSVIITRCTPALAKKGVPTAAQMSAAAKMASDDAEVLTAVVAQFREVGPPLAITTAPPEGGLQTVELTIALMDVI